MNEVQASNLEFANYLASQILQVLNTDHLQIGRLIIFVRLHSNKLDRDLLCAVIILAIERHELVELLHFGQQRIEILVAALENAQGNKWLVIVVLRNFVGNFFNSKRMEIRSDFRL